MTTNLTITTERVDDIPLVIGHLKRMQVGRLIDEAFPTHGNWQGLSLGQVTVVWLSFLVSESNHRMSHAESWVGQRRETLSASLGEEVRALDLSDDRLSRVLDYLGMDEGWAEFEMALGRSLLRVYQLQPEEVRIDTTTASSYREVSETGLFRLGHSKDHRPDLPQLKISVAAIDPLGMPITTTVVNGASADDPLYVPEIKRVREVLQCQGVTYIGDSKMGALATRAEVVRGGDYYLCPLSRVAVTNEERERLLEQFLEAGTPLTRIETEPAADVSQELIAEGFEVTVALVALVDGEEVRWTERRLLIRSAAFAERQIAAHHQRAHRACAELEALPERCQGKARLADQAALETAIAALLHRHQVEGLVTVEVATVTTERSVRAYRDRPAEVRLETAFTVSAHLNQPALAQAERRLGWQVYATNHPASQLTLAQAVRAYRAEYRIEHDFHRLKNQPLALTPLYLTSETRIVGLIRLLSIALRAITLLEFVVRQQLANEQTTLAGIYQGNPKRATAHPSTELLLKAFDGITLTAIHSLTSETPFLHLSPLNLVQRRILELLNLSQLYQTLLDHISKSPLNLSEP